MKNEILEGLNPAQQEAVLHLDSPLLVIAGAGSGKTRVITHKIAYIIAKYGYSPGNILAVTFTNRAANEMKERVKALTGIDPHKFQISTFHALGLRILREAGQALGFDGSWQVIDDYDQQKIVSRIIKDEFSHFNDSTADKVCKKIGQAKMNLIYPNNPEFLVQKGFSRDEARIFARYFDFQQKNKCWDYDDLISLPVKLLQAHGEWREKLAERFLYVLVDEFQDTNPNQYDLVKAITGRRPGITAVGDDDQAIYSWRGASIRFLLDFEHDFPGSRLIKLEQNYRSTQQVLDFANNLIVKNTARRPKVMRAQKIGNPVFVLVTGSKEDEAEKAADLIIKLKESRPDLLPVAVLYRTNAQSLNFETEFHKRDIAFKIIKGQPFFERKEIKDSLALLKLTLNPADDASFLRVVESLPVGVGEKTLESLKKLSTDKGLALFDSLREYMPEKFKPNGFLAQLGDFQKKIEEYPLSEILQTLLDKSGFLENLREKAEENRLLNIQELLDFIRKWEEENPGRDFSALFDRIYLDTTHENGQKGQKKTSVFLLTMHNAKGLEFPTVIVAGINSAYMPMFMRKETEEIEEERRLFYVASTRASSQLIISTGSSNPSNFLASIKPSLYMKAYSMESVSEFLAPADRRDERRPGREREVPPSSRADERYIEHPVFGRGKIVKGLDKNKYIIYFIDRGEKVIDTAIVPVTFL